MSHIEDSPVDSFTAASVVDRDQPRVIDATQLTSAELGKPPYPGAERVLKITVPVEPEWSQSGSLLLPVDRNRTDEIQIDLCGYVESEYLEPDNYLKKLLVETPDVHGPRVTATGRQLLNIDLPLLIRLYDSPQSPNIEMPERQQFVNLKRLVNAHERDHQTPGSHAHTLINPRTNSSEVTMNAQNLIPGYSNSSTRPLRSVIYNELCAIVSERINNSNVAVRVSVDKYRHQVGRPEYSKVLEVLNWLRTEPANERLSYGQIIDLLTAAGKHPHPVVFLTYGLYDLANGMPLGDVLYNGSFFAQAEEDSSRYYNNKSRIEALKSDSPFGRLVEETVETVCLRMSNRTLVKEWWVRDPPSVFPPPVIRCILFQRMVADFSRSYPAINQSLTPTTLPRGNIIPSEKNAIGGLRFQDQRSNLNHPYQLAMAGNNDCMTAVKMTHGGKFDRYRRWLYSKFITQSPRFENKENLFDWISGAAPSDSQYIDLVRWFQ